MWLRTLGEYFGVVAPKDEALSPQTVYVPQGNLWQDGGVMDYGRLYIYRDDTGDVAVLPHTLVKFIQEQRSEHAHG